MRTYERVADIYSLLKDNLASGNEELVKHAKTLVGPRNRGSKTLLGLKDLRPEQLRVPVMPYFDENIADGCRCYTATLSMFGKLGAVPYRLARQACRVRNSQIVLEEGEHGPELVIYDDQLLAQCEGEVEGRRDGLVDQIYFIVGTFMGEEALFTWHPGRPLARLEDGITDSVAVKVYASR